MREWSPPVATDGLADAPFRSARLVLSNHDRLDTENGHGVVARLRTAALVAVWEVRLKVVIDSSRQGTAIALPLRIDRGYVSAGRC